MSSLSLEEERSAGSSCEGWVGVEAKVELAVVVAVADFGVVEATGPSAYLQNHGRDPFWVRSRCRSRKWKMVNY